MDDSHRHSGSGEETSSSSSSRPPSKSLPPQHTRNPPAAPSRSMPVREDCWSKEATHTLVEAWGEKHLELNKGNLRQKHWREVADAVNAVHGHLRRNCRTDVQCKNRIDTIKKKYKIEKERAVESPGAYVSPWPFFVELDALIGDTAAKKPAPSPQSGHRNRKIVESWTAPLSSPATPALALSWPVPVGPRTVKPKRRVPPAMDDSFFRRTLTAVAATEAPASSSSEEERPSEEEEEEEESSISRSGGLGDAKRRGTGKRSGRGGCKQLAEAILKFGEIYERVETMKQEQLVELEKHRMEFAKELEIQRMKLLMDTQLQLAKIKRLKLSSNDDADSC